MVRLERDSTDKLGEGLPKLLSAILALEFEESGWRFVGHEAGRPVATGEKHLKPPNKPETAHFRRSWRRGK